MTTRSEYSAQQQRLRRERRKQAGPITAALRRALLPPGTKCALCGGKATALDHIKPVDLGGLTTLENLQPLCARCNATKGNIAAPLLRCETCGKPYRGHRTGRCRRCWEVGLRAYAKAKRDRLRAWLKARRAT